MQFVVSLCRVEVAGIEPASDVDPTAKLPCSDAQKECCECKVLNLWQLRLFFRQE